MILSIVVLLFVAIIAYFHYVQGFFSATLSAILAIVSAVLAFSFHEPLVHALLAGRMGDQAHAIALVVLFAGIYILLRVAFDKAIPGNIQLPVTLDRIGAAAMGVVAGLFSIGVIAIAAQSMPLGISVAGHTRYTTVDRQAQVPSIQGSRRVEARVENELRSAEFTPADSNSLWIPADDAVVGMVAHLSEGGSLAGKTPLSRIHPNYLDELFAQRLGIQSGAKLVALNVGEQQQINVANLFELESVQQHDGDFKELRSDGQPIVPPGSVIKPDPGVQMLLVVRTVVSRDATDADNRFRFSPASARLVANGQNYFPIGTMETAGAMYAHRLDDPLFVEADKTADLVYLVEREAVAPGSAPNPRTGQRGVQPQVAPGVFIEIKRLGLVDLGRREIETTYKPPANQGVIRKQVEGPKAGGQVAAADRAAAVINVSSVEASNRLFSPINVGVSEPDTSVTLASGTATLRERRFAQLNINGTEALQRLAAGDYPIDEFFIPQGSSMVQVVARTPDTGNAWQWADTIGQFALVDTAGRQYPPHGAWARVTQGGQERMVASYNAQSPIGGVERTEGRPMDVWIAYIIPSGTQLRELQYQGKQLRAVQLTVP